MWYWYLIMFLFGASFGGLATLIGLVFLPDDTEE
jgi:hypothetical protein